MQQQLHRNDHTGGEYPPSDTHISEAPHDPAAAQSRGLGGGTDVMGEPINPTSQAHDTAHAAAPDYGASYPAGSNSYVSPPTGAGLQTPYSASTTGLPPSQLPGRSAAAANQPTIAHPSQTSSPSPYVQTSSIPGGTGKTPMDSIMHVFNKWSKKAEDMTGNVWNHLKTGPNVADTAFGRLAVGTKAMAEGGLENVFRQSFEVAPEEHLLKSFACYLSTSTGPVAGTLYISTHKLAFCSDRPLAIPGSHANSATKHMASSKTRPATTDNSSAAQQQQEWVYYKVVVPISQLEAVNPSENTQKKPPERYVQVKTVDGHEFWFMGFVNYGKGVKNLQDTLAAKNVNASSTMDMNSTSHANTNTYADPITTPTNTPPTSSAANFTPSGNMYSNSASTTTNAPNHIVN